MQKIMVVIAIRPEVIKLAPVIKELERYPEKFEVVPVVTVQRRQMFDQVLRLFGASSAYDLDVMEDNQTLSSVTAKIIENFDPVVKREEPDWILIQGDTTTTFISALIGFYYKIRIGHYNGPQNSDNMLRYW